MKFFMKQGVLFLIPFIFIAGCGSAGKGGGIAGKEWRYEYYIYQYGNDACWVSIRYITQGADGATRGALGRKETAGAVTRDIIKKEFSRRGLNFDEINLRIHTYDKKGSTALGGLDTTYFLVITGNVVRVPLSNLLEFSDGSDVRSIEAAILRGATYSGEGNHRVQPERGKQGANP